MARVKKGQGEHDRRVAEVAANARGRGRTGVRAHLPGQSQPPKVGGVIPDVVWKRPGGGLAIREVDPPGKASAQDKKQDAALRRYAKEHPGTDYRRTKY